MHFINDLMITLTYNEAHLNQEQQLNIINLYYYSLSYVALNVF